MKFETIKANFERVGPNWHNGIYVISAHKTGGNLSRFCLKLLAPTIFIRQLRSNVPSNLIRPVGQRLYQAFNAFWSHHPFILFYILYKSIPTFYIFHSCCRWNVDARHCGIKFLIWRSLLVKIFLSFLKDGDFPVLPMLSLPTNVTDCTLWCKGELIIVTARITLLSSVVCPQALSEIISKNWSFWNLRCPISNLTFFHACQAIRTYQSQNLTGVHSSE